MIYIIKSTLILGILLAVYHLFLEKEKMHQFNRFYLLSGLALAFVTPLITVGAVDPVAAQSFIVTAPTLIQEVQTDIIYETEKGMDWLQFILYSYGLITIIMLLRFVNNIGILLFKAWNNPKVNHDGHKIVLLDSPCLPHTFLKYIFINRSDYESGDIDPTLFIHEFAHAEQRHSLDIIMIELISALYWFNPLVYLYKKAIQLNHEFLADEAVVRTTNHVPEYQHLLLSKASSTEQVYMASNLNFSVTKKRLMMMTKPISKRRNVIYGLMIIPLAVFLVSCFGDYDAVPVRTNKLIEYVNPDQFSVNFTGMTQEQLENAQQLLKEEGIDFKYDEVFFDENSLITHLNTKVNFNNGSTMRTKNSCDNGLPYGIWMNRSNDNYGVGHLNSSLSLENSSMHDMVIDQIRKGSHFYLESNKITQADALILIQDQQWNNDHTVHFDNVREVITFRKTVNDSQQNIINHEVVLNPIVKPYIDHNYPNATIYFQDEPISLERAMRLSEENNDDERLCISGAKNVDGTSSVFLEYN